MIRERQTSSRVYPSWLPDPVRLYIERTENGISYRALAQREGRHPSTVMRLVRRYETRRDDPLMDEALTILSHVSDAKFLRKDENSMTAPIRAGFSVADEATIEREAKRILRRLVEPNALLAIATDLDRAAVMREFPDGRVARVAVVERNIAQAFVLKDWIACRKPGRVSSYGITSVGRAALKRMVGEVAVGLAEAAQPFAAQHRDWDEKTVKTEEGPRRMRYNLAESPVAVLGRRRDKDGKLFLEASLVDAAEQLREDFELAQMGPRVAQNWERFLTGGDRGTFRSDSGLAEGPRHARDRVGLALHDLGPGLGDVALRVCCFLEGLETAEHHLGWAARSGKVVLRIALLRLRQHYDQTYGRSGPLIG